MGCLTIALTGHAKVNIFRDLDVVAAMHEDRQQAHLYPDAGPHCKAMTAISQIDIIADQIVLHQHPGRSAEGLRKLQRERREAVEDRTIRLVRDVHDTHKHGPLGRQGATIKTGQRPKKA
jgi:hypothetical protein